MPRRRKTTPAPLSEPLSEIMERTEERYSTPFFSPVPDGFRPMASYPQAGLRVLKSDDRATSAIQFAENRVPAREEKDAMELEKLRWNTDKRIWSRTDREKPGVNQIEMQNLGQWLADGRSEGRGL